MEILYENRACIACVKPVGVLSQKGRRGEENMVTLLERMQRGSLGSIYLIHRLDKEVGGVMIFAKSHDAASKLANAVEKREIRKEYLAVLRGVPEQTEGELRDWLWRDEALKKTVVVDRAHRGAKEAKLLYRVLAMTEGESGPLSLVQIQLHTGRNHQIRVQFSSRHLPLYGDDRYGGFAEAAPALWAFRLTFPDPLGGERTVMKLPSGGVWERFRLNELL